MEHKVPVLCFNRCFDGHISEEVSRSEMSCDLGGLSELNL